MSRRTIVILSLFLSVAIVSSAQASPQSKGDVDAQLVVSKWRNAVHASADEPKAAVVKSSSSEDGIHGNVQDWFSHDGPGGDAYRRTVERTFDRSEIVSTPSSTQRRDWNNWIREVKGEELKRLRTAIFEESVTVFGPPSSIPGATVSPSEDRAVYVLQLTPTGGLPTTWYIDAKTWLPLKSVRPGEDSEITTTYEEWRSEGGIQIPHRGQVSETDKPDFRWERDSVEFKSSLPKQMFVGLKPTASDAHLDPTAPAIPFTLESGHIVFRAALNGHETGFLLDTGADQNVINEARLADFGLKTYAKSMSTGGGGSADYSYARGATLTMPGVEVHDQHVAVMDETGLERALGVQLGGLLGYDFISRFVIEINYEKRLMKLHDPDKWQYSGNGAIVPLTFDMGIPFMNGTISVANHDIPAYLVLDFGAQETMTLTAPFVRDNNLVALAQTNANVNRPVGMENQFFAQNNMRGHIDQLTIGNFIVKSLPINMSVNSKGAYASKTFAGTVGETIYSRYHVFLDYARNRVIFEATPESTKPFPERQTYGLSLLAGPDLHTYTVSSVRSGSPAEKDGFNKGDVILAVDKRPATQFTLRELREYLAHAGEHHDLGIKRGERELTIPIDVRLVSIERN